MRSLPIASLVSSLVLLFLPACAGKQYAHFFPRTRPLFAGLDEACVCARAKPLLEKAKVDFQLARHGKEPRYAKYVSTIPYTQSRVYDGKGYRITMVKKDIIPAHYEGPQIVLDASITGGEPFTYDEVDVTGE